MGSNRYIWGFHSHGGIPINGFTRENFNKMDDDWGIPISGTSILEYEGNSGYILECMVVWLPFLSFSHIYIYIYILVISSSLN